MHTYLSYKLNWEYKYVIAYFEILGTFYFVMICFEYFNYDYHLEKIDK